MHMYTYNEEEYMTGRKEKEERLILFMSLAMSCFQETEFSKSSKEISDLTEDKWEIFLQEP